tara:strand:+ start:940 stop:1251 length:312 start_codon:yes stop_codon:yes gene_type:complete
MSYDFLATNFVLSLIGPILIITTLVGVLFWQGYLTKKVTTLAWLGMVGIVMIISYQKTPVRFTLTDEASKATQSTSGVIKSSGQRQTDEERLQSTRDQIEANK